MSGPRLAELPESGATGRIAELYADIRAVLGLPMVNLVYRHLATKPGVLEQSWAELRPNLASRAASAAAGELVALATPPGVASVPRAALAVAGLAGEQARLARATLEAYRRANSLNTLGMAALLHGCPGGGPGGEEAPAPRAGPILPMASLDDLAPPVATLLDEMSLHVVGPEEPRLVPSLFRHFAGEECTLALVWTALRPCVAEVDRHGEQVARSARALARSLPRPVRRLENPAAANVARRFSAATARMLVLGEMLTVALAEAG